MLPLDDMELALLYGFGLDDDGLDDRLQLDDRGRGHRRRRCLPGGHDGWVPVGHNSPSNLCFVEAPLHVVRRRAEREE